MPTGIEWADETFNPWWGCTRVSAACDFCYADAWAGKSGYRDIWGPWQPRRFFGDKHWEEPLRWNRSAEKAKVRRRVFCASMADVGEILPPKHPQREEMDEARARLWELVTKTPWLDWMLLTKRPASLHLVLPQAWLDGDWPLNAWLGTSIEDDRWAQRRVPAILRLPAPVHFLSYEPALGPVTWRAEWFGNSVAGCRAPLGARSSGMGTSVDWVICGGESGALGVDVRPMYPAWAREARLAAQLHGAAFFFKQWGEYAPLVQLDPKPRQMALFGDDGAPQRLGKRRTGSRLDGREWKQFPVSPAAGAIQ
jgi:protein gp37